MLHEVDSPGDRTPAELYELYLEAIVDAITERGVEVAADQSDVDAARLRELIDGGQPELTLEEAASILSLVDETVDAETIAMIARDELLMGMTTAVLDVEAVESGLDGELEAREIQSKIEGRFPMTLREFALLYQYIDGAR